MGEGRQRENRRDRPRTIQGKEAERARVWTFEEGAEQKGRELRVLMESHRAFVRDEFSTCFEAARAVACSVGPKRAREAQGIQVLIQRALI